MFDYNVLSFCVIAVIGISEWLKSLDRDSKLKQFYGFLPAVLAVGIAVVLVQYYSVAWYFGFVYWGVCLGMSVLGYDTIVRTIKKKADSFSL